MCFLTLPAGLDVFIAFLHVFLMYPDIFVYMTFAVYHFCIVFRCSLSFCSSLFIHFKVFFTFAFGFFVKRLEGIFYVGRRCTNTLLLLRAWLFFFFKNKWKC